jgi:hypothetical protein
MAAKKRKAAISNRLRQSDAEVADIIAEEIEGGESADATPEKNEKSKRITTPTKVITRTINSSARARPYNPIFEGAAKSQPEPCKLIPEELKRVRAKDADQFRKVQFFFPTKEGRKELPKVFDRAYRGPYLRLCYAPGSKGLLLPAPDVQTAVAIGRAYQRCVGTPKHCAIAAQRTAPDAVIPDASEAAWPIDLRKGANKPPIALGSLRRGFLKRR